MPRPQRVLIVDDAPDMRELWRCWLALWNFDVREAVNGADAVTTARRFHPHVVLMDIWMPVLDGVRATEQLKADPSTSRSRVLALSACCYAPQPQQALDAGCDVFMAKPVDADCLLEEIRAAFRRSIREGTIVT